MNTEYVTGNLKWKRSE